MHTVCIAGRMKSAVVCEAGVPNSELAATLYLQPKIVRELGDTVGMLN